MDDRGPTSALIERKLPLATGEPVIEAGELSSSGVSWGAVIGGAFVAAALALILLALGAGFGLAITSPWSGASPSTLSAGAIVWLIVTEAIACGIGGYLTGRLRTKWRTLHTDEVHFRDTANGFLAWAVAVVISVAFLGSAAVSLAGSRPAQEAAGNSAAIATPYLASPYFVDRLFRSPRAGSEPGDPSAAMEAAPIFAEALRQGALISDDVPYLAQLVAAKTGLTPAEAQRRVLSTIASALDAENAARKALARLLLWTFIALLTGAFCASFAATAGGRQRDRVKTI